MNQAGRNDTLSILQILISGVGLAFTLLAGGVLTLIGIAALFGKSASLSESLPIFTLAWEAALVAALAIPSIVYSALRLSGRAVVRIPGWFSGYRLAWVCLLFWPGVVALGRLVSTNASLAWFLLPPLSLLAIGIPIFWIVEIASHKLNAGSPQRGWGVVSFSIFLSFPTAMVVEIISLVVLALAAFLAAASHPEWVAEIQRFALRLQDFPNIQNNPDRLLQVIKPLLQNPLIIFTLFAALSGVAPLVEELVKPLAIWALTGKNLTPAQGFVTGALCGAVFTLLESLLNLTGPPPDAWFTLVIGRLGTALLHISTTALLGWGLATAWQYGSYIRLGITYLISVSLHGLWNALTIITSASVLQEPGSPGIGLARSLAAAAPFGLAALAILYLLLLWGGNRLLRRAPQTLPKFD